MPQKSTRGCSRPCHALAPDTLQGCPLMDHPGCAGLMPPSAPAASPPRAPLCRAFWDTPACTTSASAVLPGHSLYREPWHPPAYTCFTFSYPSKVPSAQRVPGPPQPIPTSALAFPPGQFRHRVSQDPLPMTATDPASQPIRRWGRIVKYLPN